MPTRRCPYCDVRLTPEEEEDRYCNSCRRYLPFDDQSVLRPSARRERWPEEEEPEDREPDSRPRTQTPAIWLRISAVMEFVLSTCCLFGGCVIAAGLPGTFGPGNDIPDKEVAVVFGVLAIGGGLATIGMGVVVLLGARALASRRRYGLALTGAILALVLGLKSLIYAGLTGMGGLAAIEERQDAAMIAGSCIGSILGLAASVVDLIAGIWGLVVLSNERVRNAFR